MSIIWISDKSFSHILDCITFCMMIKYIINSCITFIHPVINLGVSFMNIYHEYKIIYIYEDNMGGVLASQSCGPYFGCNNISSFFVLIYCFSLLRLKYNA